MRAPDEAPVVELGDYERRYGTPADPERVEALLHDASDALLSEYEARWGEPWREGAHPAFDRNMAAVCCSMVHRVEATPAAFAGATQYSQAAGSYNASVTLANPLGDLYVGKADRRRLGLAGCRVGSLRPMGGRDRA